MPLLRFIPETTNVDFVKYRFVAFAIDGLLVLVSVISIFWHGFNLGIDFKGGVLMEVQVRPIHRRRKDARRGIIQPSASTIRWCRYSAAGLRHAGQFLRDDPRAAQGRPVLAWIRTRSTSRRCGQGKLNTGYTYRNAEVVGPKVSQRTAPGRHSGNHPGGGHDLALCRGALRMAVWRGRLDRHRP
jgi:preprotein translocase subunit SecF